MVASDIHRLTMNMSSIVIEDHGLTQPVTKHIHRYSCTVQLQVRLKCSRRRASQRHTDAARLSHQICQSTSVSLASVASASFSCATCVEFAVHWMTSQLTHSYTHSSPQASTTVTACRLAYRRPQQTSSSVSRTLTLDLSQARGSLIE